MATLQSYKIKIATLVIVLIVAIVNTANADIVKDFGNSLGITYAEADYRVHSNEIVIKNARYKGFLLGQVTINHAKQSSMEILGIKKGSLSIAYLKAELGSLPALFDTISALMAAVQAGLSEERYMAEEETMCEGDYDSDDGCTSRFWERGHLIKFSANGATITLE